ncbi:MAG: hypothetical protein HY506_01195 [Candidatus Yanofskybacteria bacterium]|nr:hypothetical protein [Candidatus Yanofskybacteria bacterium]
MKGQTRFTPRRFLLALAVLTPALFLSWLSFLIGDYYKYLDNYSGDIVRRDQIAAREDLENLNYFYQLNQKIRPFQLDWIADKYLFENARYYKAAYDFLTNRHERVVEGDLKDDENFWARYLRANSRWRIAQGAFSQIIKLKDVKQKSEAFKKADEMAYSTKEDYEEAVKMAGGKHSASSWNYDLTTNASARANALIPKPPKIKVRLGLGGNKNKGKGKQGDGPSGEGSLDLKIDNLPDKAKQKPDAHRPG